MKQRESGFHRHVRTSLAARIVYRIICLVLIALGVWSLSMAMTSSDHYHSYASRDNKAVATVTKLESVKDDKYDDVMYCFVEYKFKVDDKEYSSKTAWRSLPSQLNCQLSKDATITIRYEKGNPANNAYNDNSQDREVAKLMTIAYLLVGIVSLGIGFIGLIAIRKAVRSELQGEEADKEAEIRAIKRRASVAAKQKAKQGSEK